MRALGYAPHVTLAVYDHVSEAELRAAVSITFGKHPAFKLRFNSLSQFVEPQVVFWANPDPSSVLQRAHARVHDFIDPVLCRPHYRPGSWVPHCTLATNIDPRFRAEAMALAAVPIDPFEIIFDIADCIVGMPIKVLEEIALRVVG